MVVVIDTNIIFSMLITKNSPIRERFFESKDTFYSPNYIFVEIFKKKERMLKLSPLSEVELYELLNRIFQGINFISESAISKKNKHQAYELCKDIDEDDTPIIALSLELDAKVWTGDKKLKKGLGDKGFDNFFEF